VPSLCKPVRAARAANANRDAADRAASLLYVLSGQSRAGQGGQPISSRIAFFTCVGTGAYFSGSITLLARPVLIDRSSVV